MHTPTGPAKHKRDTRRRAWLGVAATVLLLNCSGERPSTPDPQDELERLRALGYVGFSDEKVDPDEQAVTLYDPERSQPGYNLISNRDLTSAQLFDARGTVLRTWEDPGANHWSNAELLANGDLLVTGSEQVDATGSNFLLRLSWDGSLVWRSKINAHHDAELTPRGTIATLTFGFRRIPAVSEEYDVKDHQIAILSPDDGRLIEEASLYDLLCTKPDMFACREVAPKTQQSETFIDLLHPNSLEFMHHPHLVERHPIYAPSNVLVSLRNQDALAIFDWEKRELVWTWGPGEISAQHDARVLENGNILLFDNGMDRSWSRIVELDPVTRTIVWEYKAPEPEQFFSLRKGSSQRLSNGNTLVANSDSGEAFEVTAQGEIVWRFLNPNADDKGHRATIVRIHRYDEGFIRGLMDGERSGG